jgi:hypothetical protein
MEVIKKSDKIKRLAADLAEEAKKSVPKRPLFIRIIKNSSLPFSLIYL